MQELEKKIEYELLCRAERVKASRPPVELPLQRPPECEDRLSGRRALWSSVCSLKKDLQRDCHSVFCLQPFYNECNVNIVCCWLCFVCMFVLGVVIQLTMLAAMEV